MGEVMGSLQQRITISLGDAPMGVDLGADSP